MQKKFNYGKNCYPSGIVKTAQLPHTPHPTPHTPHPTPHFPDDREKTSSRGEQLPVR
ncbi:hypothetical protein [Microcystis sp. LE19-195.1E]|uniref:hypothetical protein n=1 Tax=Microcystis sp. LE19-195.1E TaxID=3016440 RepID=UPI00258786A6|nr:hypothetical protein [Microcystis sp. LE19-195.1E]